MILNLLVARTNTALSTPMVVKSSNQQRNGRKYPALKQEFPVEIITGATSQPFSHDFVDLKLRIQNCGTPRAGVSHARVRDAAA